MNLLRKVEVQDRKIKSLQSQIDKLKDENSALKAQNKELQNKEVIYKQKIEAVDAVRKEYEACLSETAKVKESYQMAVMELRGMKKKYNKQFKKFMGTMAHNV